MIIESVPGDVDLMEGKISTVGAASSLPFSSSWVFPIGRTLGKIDWWYKDS